MLIVLLAHHRGIMTKKIGLSNIINYFSFDSNASEKILSYFKEQVQARIVVREGDTSLLEGLEFKVIKTDPSPFCRVTSETKLNCGDQIKTNIVPVNQVNTVRDFIFQLSTACGALVEKKMNEQTKLTIFVKSVAQFCHLKRI